MACSLISNRSLFKCHLLIQIFLATLFKVTPGTAPSPLTEALLFSLSSYIFLHSIYQQLKRFSISLFIFLLPPVEWEF